MNTKLAVTLCSGVAALLAASLTYAAINRSSIQTKQVRTGSIERGRYLVHEVAMCIDCHSPRGPDGQFVETQHLTGSPLAFVPTIEMPWTDVAPPIAGLPGYTREQAITFLMTGERPSKTPILPPMPAVRMDRADAESVADYLFSLNVY